MVETITGSCHCGAVRFEITVPDEVIHCNCALCRRTGALWAYIPPAKGRVIADPSSAHSYTHGDKTIEFHTCGICGASTHWQSLLADTVAVNMRLVDDPNDLDWRLVRSVAGDDPNAFVS